MKKEIEIDATNITDDNGNPRTHRKCLSGCV